jgi:hypothetical protein
LGFAVFSCDYNGWADVPEDEREAIDAFEAARPLLIARPVQLALRTPPSLPRSPLTKAA